MSREALWRSAWKGQPAFDSSASQKPHEDAASLVATGTAITDGAAAADRLLCGISGIFVPSLLADMEIRTTDGGAIQRSGQLSHAVFHCRFQHGHHLHEPPPGKTHRLHSAGSGEPHDLRRRSGHRSVQHL